MLYKGWNYGVLAWLLSVEHVEYLGLGNCSASQAETRQMRPARRDMALVIIESRRHPESGPHGPWHGGTDH